MKAHVLIHCDVHVIGINFHLRARSDQLALFSLFLLPSNDNSWTEVPSSYTWSMPCNKFKDPRLGMNETSGLSQIRCLISEDFDLTPYRGRSCQNYCFWNFHLVASSRMSSLWFCSFRLGTESLPCKALNFRLLFSWLHLVSTCS